MKKIIIIILLLPFISFAEISDNVAAIVGDEIISTNDVYDRVNFALYSLNLERNQENADKILPQILQQLIDEKIIEKESKDLEISVTNEEINHSINDLEQQNNINVGSFKDFIENSALSIYSLINQIKGQILWSKLIAQEINHKINVTEIEIEDSLNSMIFEKTEVTFKHISYPLSIINKNNLEAVTEKLENITDTMIDCKNIDQLIHSRMKEAEINLIKLPIDDINLEIRNIIKILPVGKVSKIIKSPDSLSIIIVCSKNSMSQNLQNKELISNSIMQKKLSAQLIHYLNILRKKTLIEVYI